MGTRYDAKEIMCNIVCRHYRLPAVEVQLKRKLPRELRLHTVGAKKNVSIEGGNNNAVSPLGQTGEALYKK